MRWKIQPSGHDPQQIDLLAVAVMILVAVAIGYYLSEPAKTHLTSSLIVPSQTVRW